MRTVEPANAESLLEGRSGKICPLLVDVSCLAHRVTDPDHHRRVVGHVAEELFAFAERTFSTLSLCNVSNNAADRVNLSLHIEERKFANDADM